MFLFCNPSLCLAVPAVAVAGVCIAGQLHPHDKSRQAAEAPSRRLEVLRNFVKLWALARGRAEVTPKEFSIMCKRGSLRECDVHRAPKLQRPEFGLGAL